MSNETLMKTLCKQEICIDSLESRCERKELKKWEKIGSAQAELTVHI